MMKYGVMAQVKAIQFLNPSQIMVTAFDVPLFALAKLVQLNWPDIYGSPCALNQASVASSGTVDRFLKFYNLQEPGMPTRSVSQF